MRIYREKYTQDGKRKTSKKWYIDFVDHHNRRHRMPGFVEKRHTQTFADNIEALIGCRIAGQSLPPELQRWITGQDNGKARLLGTSGRFKGAERKAFARTP